MIERYIMKNNVKMSAFISYRSNDGKNNPYEIYNYLISRGIDCFYDEREMRNNDGLDDVLIKEIISRDNFIFLFSEKTINTLVGKCKNANPYHPNKDYVFLELKTAITNAKNIIPVCLDVNIDGNELQDKIDYLFNQLCYSSSPSYIIKSDNDYETHERINDRLTKNKKVNHIDLSNVIWVGTRYSDLPQINECYGFKGSISFFGDKETEDNLIMCTLENEKRVDHNDSTDLNQDKFVIESVKKINKKYPDSKFMFYNPSSIYRLGLDKSIGKDKFVCLNSFEILDLVNNKRKFRNWAKHFLPLNKTIERNRADCEYDDLLEEYRKGSFKDENQNYGVDVYDIKYDDDIKFVIQAPVSSGGEGTFLMDKSNSNSVLAELDKKSDYLVSIYFSKNISVNMHVIIYESDIVYSPGSIQLMREVPIENKLLYKGADFIAYKTIQDSLRSQFENQVKILAKKLQEIGYRGVCGIDAIIHDDRVNILEINGRFQASTALINNALLTRGHKTIQELNLEAFSLKAKEDTFLNPSFYVNYSNYTYTYEAQIQHDYHILNNASRCNNTVCVQTDGFNKNNNKRYIAEAYLFRVVFSSNIASIDENNKVLVNENICTPDKWLIRKIKSKDKLVLKIALLIQGIIIDDSIKRKLREATNNAVDLKVDDLIINSPTNIKFVEFSPFRLIESDEYHDKYCIKYYDEKLIDNVGVFPTDKNQDLLLSDGKHNFSEIAYLSTDRLRVHLTNACCFKTISKNSGCKFCNIEINNNPNPITENDVSEVVDKYISDEEKNMHSLIKLRHFLIGGQTLNNCDKQIVATARQLAEYSFMNTYVMSVPLKNDTVVELIKAGVSEFAYNIEIFDEKCRLKYMPEKGKITIESYFKALIDTKNLLMHYAPTCQKNVVRTMIIVGLEPDNTMLEGIRRVIRSDIEPMLSIFRPLPDTPLENLNAPTIKSIYDLYSVIENIMNEENSSIKNLGPECVCCQNNTVSLPWSK